MSWWGSLEVKCFFLIFVVVVVVAYLCDFGLLFPQVILVFFPATRIQPPYGEGDWWFDSRGMPLRHDGRMAA